VHGVHPQVGLDEGSFTWTAGWDSVPGGSPRRPVQAISGRRLRNGPNRPLVLSLAAWNPPLAASASAFIDGKRPDAGLGLSYRAEGSKFSFNHTSDFSSGRVCLLIVIVLIPIAFRVPAVLVFIPPLMPFTPAALPGVVQFTALMICTAAVSSVFFDCLVEFMLRVSDSPLTAVEVFCLDSCGGSTNESR
jgi:hypothetical protein